MAKLTDDNLKEIKDFLLNYFSENPDELYEIIKECVDSEMEEYITEDDLEDIKSESKSLDIESVIEEIKDRL